MRHPPAEAEPRAFIALQDTGGEGIQENRRDTGGSFLARARCQPRRIADLPRASSHRSTQKVSYADGRSRFCVGPASLFPAGIQKAINARREHDPTATLAQLRSCTGYRLLGRDGLDGGFGLLILVSTGAGAISVTTLAPGGNRMSNRSSGKSFSSIEMLLMSTLQEL